MRYAYVSQKLKEECLAIVRITTELAVILSWQEEVTRDSNYIVVR